MSKVSSFSGNKRDPTSSETKTHVHHQQPRVVNEVKNKAQTLKDMRDYSFLLSDDADLPASEGQQPSPPRNISVSKSDGRSAQTPSSRIHTGKPVRPASNGNLSKNLASTDRHMQSKVGLVKEGSVSGIKPASTESRKVLSRSAGNGSVHTTKVVKNGSVHATKVVKNGSVYATEVVSTGNKTLPPKIPAQITGTNRAPAKTTSDPSMKKNPSSTKLQSSAQNHHLGQKRVSQGPENPRLVPKQPLPSLKAQPSKQIPSRGIHDDRPKKRPAKRDFDEEEDIDDVRGLIRKMFRYDPSKYAGNDEDDSDMEVGFDRIQREERMSTKIALREDEEQLRLIEQEEEEERRRKTRKKRKLCQ